VSGVDDLGSPFAELMSNSRSRVKKNFEQTIVGEKDRLHLADFSTNPRPLHSLMWSNNLLMIIVSITMYFVQVAFFLCVSPFFIPLVLLLTL